MKLNKILILLLLLGLAFSLASCHKDDNKKTDNETETETQTEEKNPDEKNGQYLPVNDKEYLFGMYQGNTKKTVFLTGNMKGYYLETTTDKNQAIKVKVTKVSDGFTLSVNKDGKTLYLSIEEATGTDGKSHTNAVYSNAQTSFTWNEADWRLEKVLGDKTYAFGTRSDKEYETVGAVDVTKPSFIAGLYDVNNPETNPDNNDNGGNGGSGDLPLPPSGELIPENEPASVTAYYKDVNNDLRGEELIASLTTTINRGFQHYSYGEVERILRESDADPKHPGHVICFYTGQSLSGGWNKEHVWAKSHGFPSKSNHAYSDAHHLRPTLNSINSARGNSDFDEVTNGKTDGYGNEWTSSVFEPRDEVKGDVARIMFYMVAKYNNVGGLNLTLVNHYTSTGSQTFGMLNTLLKWHYQDPVSEFEMNRNNVVYSYQKNRNPFIDRPEYVGLCFQSDMKVDQAKVDNVKNKINELPALDKLTLDNEKLVMDVNKLYMGLNLKEKQLVTNYETLKNAVKKINDLKGVVTPDPDKPNPEPNPDPVLPEGDALYHANFGSNIESMGYTHDVNLTVDGKPFYVSSMFSDGSLRLGFNAKAATNLDTKYGLGSVKGSVLEAKFDLDNISGIKVQVTNSSYGGTDKYYVLFQEKGSSTYTKVAEGATSGITSISASLDAPKSGHFVIAITGDSARLDLGSYDILKPQAKTLTYIIVDNKNDFN